MSIYNQVYPIINFPMYLINTISEVSSVSEEKQTLPDYNQNINTSNQVVNQISQQNNINGLTNQQNLGRIIEMNDNINSNNSIQIQWQQQKPSENYYLEWNFHRMKDIKQKMQDKLNIKQCHISTTILPYSKTQYREIEQDGKRSFFISGEKTENQKKINIKDIAQVQKCEFQKKKICCQGIVKPSCDALIHSLLYAKSKEICAIIQIFDIQIWKFLQYKVATISSEKMNQEGVNFNKLMNLNDNNNFIKNSNINENNKKKYDLSQDDDQDQNQNDQVGTDHSCLGNIMKQFQNISIRERNNNNFEEILNNSVGIFLIDGMKGQIFVFGQSIEKAYQILAQYYKDTLKQEFGKKSKCGCFF